MEASNLIQHHTPQDLSVQQQFCEKLSLTLWHTETAENLREDGRPLGQT